MDIILLQDIDKVGDKHEIVTVRPGYARNFLIPQKMAIVANAQNRAKLDELRRKETEVENARKAEYQEIADRVRDKVLLIGAKAGTSGKIFGSVTNVQLAAALKDQFDIEVDRKKIIMPEEVKELGTYVAQLNLHKQVDAKVTFEVVAE